METWLIFIMLFTIIGMLVWMTVVHTIAYFKER